MEIIDGKEIASEIALVLKSYIDKRGSAPILGIITGNTTPVTLSYVARKETFARDIGVRVEHYALPEEGSTSDALRLIHELASRVDGLLVQLPLSEGYDTNLVLGAIPQEKDVDALNPSTRKMGTIQSPVALAIIEILDSYVPDWQSQKIAVIGQGWLVGAPLVEALRFQKVAPLLIDKDTDESQKQSILGKADIIISGAGVPSIVKSDMIREGVVLIDAGTATRRGSVEGDISPECYKKARLVSATPGGVGPIAVAKLFENLLKIT
ncbi:MAG: tetrahydrofolate dehydrogenase/cyclohydrolase catalytic domain-containing protein [Patescibacteria group bacterium]